MKNVLLVNYTKFPDGDAGGIRVLSFAKAIQRLGYNVRVLTSGNERNMNGLYQGINYSSLRTINRYFNRIFFIPRVIRELLKIKSSININYIIGYGSNALLVLILKFYCSYRGIVFICDVVEWYSKEQFANYPLSLNYWVNNIQNRFILSKGVRIIAISKYLENYYINKGCHVVRIPIFFEEKLVSLNKSNPQKIVIFYAGSPGKKDYLYTMLEGIALLSADNLEKISFIIAGVDVNTIKDNISDLCYNKIVDSIIIKGRINRDSVIDIYKTVDFSVLLRDPCLRVSKAGFPSKVVESMINGIPMICNLSSDLGDYLIDNENSLIVDGFSAQEFAKTLNIAINLSSEELNRISKNAHRLTINHFNLDSHKTQFKNILS